MNKQAFLDALRQGLAGLPSEEADERLHFYEEMIDDRVEDGLSEEEAVAQIGSVDEVLAQISGEIPLHTLVKQSIQPRRTLRAWEIVLLVLGAPIWGSLLLAALAVVFALYIVLWALVIVIYAVTLSLAVSGLACIAALFFGFADGLSSAGMLIGAGLVCMGLAVLLGYGCVQATRGVIKLTGNGIRGLKSRMMRKGNTK